MAGSDGLASLLETRGMACLSARFVIQYILNGVCPCAWGCQF
ncbi:hypothetical protein HMPREF1985_00280 [Mitsuokella sp. oral taxon 131 str. W9106]|nr:hypothetical protein HMPREF1985_00280 [Mitsuokella sp. oral taxon 131 str. W9106]